MESQKILKLRNKREQLGIKKPNFLIPIKGIFFLYYLYILMNIKKDELDIDTLKKTITNTFNKRNTIFDTYEFNIIAKELRESNEIKILWKEYQNKNSYADNIEFIDTIKAIETIIKILEETLVVA